jgi:gluconolactonase
MIFVRELGNPEGPVLLPDGSWAITEMRPDRGCVTHISADGLERRVIARTGRPNGLALDREGVLWVAESLEPSLLRLTMDGEFEVVMTECNGEAFLFPNDLCFGPDGALYMTDSGVLQREWASIPADERRGIRPDGRVYRIDLKSMAAEKLDSGIPFANGVAFGPGGYLYVTATLNGMVYRYQWREGKGLGEREEFGNVIDPELPEGYRGPDGIAFGTDGNLYVTVSRQGDVTVLGPDGGVVRRIKLDGPSPTNVAFGPPGEGKIYVTEQGTGQMEVFEVGTDGLSLYT